MKARPPSRFRNAELAEARFGTFAAEYAVALSSVDELADAALAALAELGESGPPLIEAALSAGIDSIPDAPEAVRRLFAEPTRLRSRLTST